MGIQFGSQEWPIVEDCANQMKSVIEDNNPKRRRDISDSSDNSDPAEFFFLSV